MAGLNVFSGSVLLRRFSVCLLIFCLAPFCSQAVIIFDDDFEDTVDATQSNLVAGVAEGSWIQTNFDTSTIETGSSEYMNFGRGDYDYTAVFSSIGRAADGGTISMDLAFGDAVHDYNTVVVMEGTNELFRIEVQTNDGGSAGADRQINLVGATTQTIAEGIDENATPNRTFTFTLDETGVDLAITGSGITGSLDASVDYSGTPVLGVDRIRFYKNDFFGNTDRGQLRVDNIQADFNAVMAREVLVDFDDGNGSNGIHDSAVNDGDFQGQGTGSGVAAPWVALVTTPQFQDGLESGIGGARNGTMANTRELGVDTGQRLAIGDIYVVEFFWRDASAWDADDEFQVVLFYTNTDAIGGTATTVFTAASGPRNSTVTWEGDYDVSPPFADNSGAGKTLFAKLVGTGESGEFARFDNIYIELIRVAARGGIFTIR